MDKESGADGQTGSDGYWLGGLLEESGFFGWRGELMSDETGLHLTKFTASSLDFSKLNNGSKDFFISIFSLLSCWFQ